MAKNKKVVMRYYQLQPRETNEVLDPEKLSRLLEELADKEEFLTIDYYGRIVSLYENRLHIHDGIIRGTLVSNQMNNIPTRYSNVTKKMRPLTRSLQEDEGLAVHSCFIIDVNTNILAIESKQGLTIKAAVLWLAYNLDNADIVSSIVINPGSLERFHRMGHITLFELRIAKLTSGKYLNDNSGTGSKAVDSVLRSADETDTDKIFYRVQTDASKRRAQYRSSLRIPIVSQMVSALRRYSREDAEVEKIYVEGYSDSGDKLMINLVKDELFDVYYVESEKGRFVTDFLVDSHFRSMTMIYRQRRQVLTDFYSVRT